MPRSLRAYGLAAAVGTLLLSGLASAWTPYGEGVPGGFGPLGPQPLPFPGMPWEGGTLPMPEPGFPPGFASLGGPPRFSLARTATEEAYLLDIRLHGWTPEQVQIEVQGPWLRIQIRDEREEQYQEDRDAGGGTIHRYRYSFGQRVRRLPLPRDADTEAMIRENRASEVRITLPRRR